MKIRKKLWKANIKNKPYSFDHTYATNLIRNNFNLKVVKNLIGLHSIDFTLKTYVHDTFRIDENELKDISVIDKISLTN